jgi:hypothetical protein
LAAAAAIASRLAQRSRRDTRTRPAPRIPTIRAYPEIIIPQMSLRAKRSNLLPQCQIAAHDASHGAGTRDGEDNRRDDYRPGGILQ